MSEHIVQWLGAYLDGELGGNLLRRVETHLLDCPACLEEYESLQKLSDILRGDPHPVFISAAHFASRVTVQLPPQPGKSRRARVLEAGWWMIPVSLMALWIFIQIAHTLGHWFFATGHLAFISPAGWSWPFAPETTEISSTLGALDLLGGRGLEWASWSESLLRNLLSRMTWHISIAMLYLSWMAISWARRKRAANGQSLEASSHSAVS